MANLTIPLVDQRFGIWSYSSCFSRLNIDVKALDLNSPAMALTDLGATKLVDHPRFMPKTSLDILLNRDRLSETGLPTLPTVVIENPNEVPEGFLVKTRNSVTGGWVYQPHLGFPQQDLDITFAVDSTSNVITIACLRLTHIDTEKCITSRMATIQEIGNTIELLKDVCARLQIRGGIHNVQFLWYNDNWCLTDWNPRPPDVYNKGLVSLLDFLDRPLSFMMGLPLPIEKSFVFKTKGFWDSPLSISLDSAIRNLGLIPRRYGNSPQITRVSGVDTSQENLDNKFSMLEDLI